MFITDDREWFAANPNRSYRVRRVPHDEAAFWKKPPSADRIPFCIVRHADAETRCFTLPAYAALDDTDEELAPIFAKLPGYSPPSLKTFPPTTGGALARIEVGLSALLVASVPFEPDTPPAEAYRKEMRARGRKVLALGGRETLAYLADRIAEAMPERAAIHAAILQVAWDGLMEPRP